MYLQTVVFFCSALLSLCLAQNNTHLNITALAVSQNATVLECWQLANPFVISASVGTVGAATTQLGPLANATYTVLPPRFDGGLHNAPHPQYVYFSSGLANVSLPHHPDIAIIHGGAKGLIFAADSTGDGHFTTYPGDYPTVSLQIPTAGGLIPNHTVLYSGPCKARDIKVFGT